jgi:Transposase IS66 family
LHAARRAVRTDPVAFLPADAALRRAVTAMAAQGEAERADPTVQPARRKVLASWGDHGTGLTVFVEHPDVPMDNNTAERTARGPVVGRKNYYGSGAVWAGQLAALLFSLLQTLCLWKINPRTWWTAYLTACAAAGGQASAAVEDFWPWNVDEELLQSWSRPGSAAAADTS